MYLFRAGSAVPVPDADGLAVLRERPKEFAETIDELADDEAQLGLHEVSERWLGANRWRVWIGGKDRGLRGLLRCQGRREGWR